MSADDAGFRRLGRAVRDAQAPLVDAAALAARGVDERSARRSTRVGVGVVALAAALLLVVVGALAVRITPPAPSLGFEVGDRAGMVGEWVANTAPVPLAFSDGSSVLLGADTRAQVTNATARGATVRVERGHLSASIMHADTTAWTFEVGPYEVLVTGTRFDASWDPVRQKFELKLLEGSVVASGPQLPRKRVVAGQQLDLSPVPQTVDRPLEAITPEALPSEAMPPGPSTTQEPPPPQTSRDGVSPAPPRSPRSPGEPTWVRSLRAGDEADGVDQVERSGLLKVLQGRTAKDLLLLADAARRVSHPATSSAAYEAVRRRFPRSSESARAAFGLGLLQPSGAEARRWFSTYLREAPDGSLAREALGRMLETQLTDEPLQAKDTARRYLERWPQGPHARLAKKALE